MYEPLPVIFNVILYVFVFLIFLLSFKYRVRLGMQLGNAVRKGYKIIAYSVLICLVIGILLNRYVLKTNYYRSLARLILTQPTWTSGNAVQYKPGSATDVKSLIPIMRNPDIAKRAVKILKKDIQDVSWHYLNGYSDIHFDESSNSIVIAFETPDPEKSALFANAYSNAFVDWYADYTDKNITRISDNRLNNLKNQINDVNSILSKIEDKTKADTTNDVQSALNSDYKEAASKLKVILNEQIKIEKSLSSAEKPQIRIIQKALVTIYPIRPDRRKNIALMLIIGFFIGIGISMLLEEMKEPDPDEVRNKADSSVK